MRILLAIAVAFLLAACVNRIGDFTVASTKNIDIKKSLHVVDTKHRVKGQDTKHIIIFIPTGIPNIKEALDNAEEVIPTCVGLSNVTIKQGWWYIPYIYGQEWFEVEGNPVFEAEDGIPDLPESAYGEPQRPRRVGPNRR